MAVPLAELSLTVIGGYPLLEKIGSGGMGSVYKSQHPRTGEPVAVKVVCTKKDSAIQVSQRFAQEITAALGLRHPNLVRGLDHGSEGDFSFLVMELVEGESLGDRIDRIGRLPEAEAVAIIVQVAAALDYVHRLGIIHRDVKPDNILLASDGTAKLTDLGLIKDTAYDLNLTRVATGLGTPNFMAPEQFSEAKDAGVLCDVYSLGATLYVTVTGLLPFDAKTDLAMFKKKFTNKIAPPRELVDGLSERADLAIRRSIRADAGERFPGISEFIEALTGQPFPDPTTLTSGAQVERRAAPRFESAAVGRCSAVGDRQDAGWKTRVKDVSATGIGLVLKRRFEPKSTLFVEIDGKSGDLTSMMVRVVRAQESGPGKWLLGCTFCRRIADEDLTALLE